MGDSKRGDLLKRERIDIDLNEIASYLYSQTILITGAGGSIGSELAKQVANFNPKSLILLDNNENNIYYVDMDLKEKANVTSIIADIKDKHKIDAVFKTYKPKIIFHAAAHKHIPFMELYPEEAVKNNILGTKNVLDAAIENEATHFVFISSDKAVNPTSIMGTTKRIGEKLVQAQNKIKAVSVRFGNVLESEGSVVPLFRRQIEKGGPVTVTHPDMKRYFMTTHEAVQLIIQAAAMGRGGETLILDMGKPVKIIDIAKKLIEDSEKEIEIKFIGKRLGEKIEEELFIKKEKPTKHEKIFIMNGNHTEKDRLFNDIKELEALAHNPDREGIKKKLKEIVPEYNSED